MFHQNDEHSRLKGPPDFKCALCDYTASKTPSITTESVSMVRFYNSIEKIFLYCKVCKFSCTKDSLLTKHMYKKHDGLAPKPNHVFKLCDYTYSIKQVSAIHMHKEHDGAAPVQMSCNMCPFTSHLSDV